MNPDKKLTVSAIALMGLIAAVGLIRGVSPVRVTAQPRDPAYDQYRTRPTVPVTGYFRDFTPAGQAGGHPDFGVIAAAGGGRYANIAGDFLNDHGVPAFRSTGNKIFRNWRDVHGRAIAPPRSYINSRPGDVAGAMSNLPGGAVTGSEHFATWFREAPGVNTSARGTFTFTRNPSTGEYGYSGFLEGPSPSGSTAIDDGNASTTYTVDTIFVHERGAGQFIEVATDADAWVYVDGRLVIDGGGGARLPTVFPGISVQGGVVMENNSRVEVAPGSGGVVTTNATSAGVVSLSNSASIQGSLQIGPGGDPATAVVGGSRVTGGVTALGAPVPIPSIALPTGLGDSRGRVHFDGVTRTIGESFRCTDLVFDGNNLVTVQGHVAILCDSATIRNRTTIELAHESSLEIYCLGAFTVDNYVNLNVNTMDPGRVTIYVLGTTPISLPNNATLVANFVSPNVGMTVGNSVTVIGGYFGASLLIQNLGRFVVQPSGTTPGSNDSHAAMTQRIDLDRLNWLQDGDTCTLKMFFADRSPPKSVFTIRTNIETLNLAALPRTNKKD